MTDISDPEMSLNVPLSDIWVTTSANVTPDHHALFAGIDMVRVPFLPLNSLAKAVDADD